MGSRYLLSGAQLGTLIALCQIDKDKCNKMLNDICENQNIGNSTRNLNDDIRTAKKFLKG